MEKVHFNFTLNEEQKAVKKKLIEELKVNPIVLKWLKDNKLDESYLNDHSATIADWVDQLKGCDQCKGIEACKQPRKGAYLDLTYNGVLLEQIVKCSYALKEENALAHKKQYRICDLSESNLKINLSDIVIDHESVDYKRVLNYILDFLMEEKHEKGIYFYGRPGVGKTYLAAGISNYYAKKDKMVSFVNVARLIGDIKNLFGDNDAVRSKINQLKKVEVLVLDDIGGESITRWSRDEILLPVLDYRMENHLLTIFTSNFSFDDLHHHFELNELNVSDKIGADRIMDRIKALSCEKFINGSSRRI
ncbi:MAG: ATP-binding protein [Erysipelotrichaceae bacterium]